MGWTCIPDVDNSSSSGDTNQFAAPSVQLPTDKWLCKKMDKHWLKDIHQGHQRPVAIQTRPDDSEWSPPRGLPSNMQQVASTADRPICYKVQQQVDPVCVNQYQTPWLGQSTHSACLRRIWIHMPSHQWPSLGKW